MGRFASGTMILDIASRKQTLLSNQVTRRPNPNPLIGTDRLIILAIHIINIVDLLSDLLSDDAGSLDAESGIYASAFDLSGR